MSSISIDLDATGRVSDTPESGIRQSVLRSVIEKLYERSTPRLDAPDARQRRPTRLDVMPVRRHDAILVSARRGDGKTTFLAEVMSVIQKIQEGTSVQKLVPSIDRISGGCKLYSLGLIDPTLIESKQNIMVLILERIKAAVDAAQHSSRSASRAVAIQAGSYAS